MSLNKGDTKKDPDVESGDKAQVPFPRYELIVPQQVSSPDWCVLVFCRTRTVWVKMLTMAESHWFPAPEIDVSGSTRFDSVAETCF